VLMAGTAVGVRGARGDMGDTGSRESHRSGQEAEPSRGCASVPGVLDRESPLPLWAQLLDELRRRLVAKELEGRFPTDRELMVTYQVSRHTVREAVRRLEAEGLVVRRRGRAGSFVRSVEFEQPTGMLYSLFREIEARGVEQRSVVLSIGIGRNAEAAERLGVDSDRAVFHLERLRLAGGIPLALDTAWLRAEVGEALLDVDFSHTALYDELGRRVGVRPEEGEERVMPVIPAPSERRMLGLDTTEAVFAIDRQTRYQGEPLEWRQSVVRGDRYAFVLAWSKTAGGEAVLGPSAVSMQPHHDRVARARSSS